MSKMTDWFPPYIKPVRKGVYEVKDSFYGTMHSNWNGKSWDVGCVYVNYSFAPSYRHRKGDHQNKYWRGLTEKQA